VNALQIPAQSPQTNGAPLPTFEVATIRLNRSGDLRAGALFRPGRFVTRAATINLVIALAYNVYPLKIFGGPNWVTSERYDIQAKESDATAEELRKLPPEQAMEKQALLLQSLLADRFQLKLTRGTKELPAYALVVAKNGPKLQEAKPVDTPTDAPSAPGGHPHGPMMRMGRGELNGQGVGLGFLASVLSQQLGRQVLDQTGLKGNYDLALKWTPDQGEGMMMGGPPPGGGPPPDGAPPPDASGPSIFTALQEQLGLRLEATKAPADVLTIDHVEKPSEN